MRRTTVYGLIWAALVIGGSVFLGTVYNPLLMSGYARQSLAPPDYETTAQLKALYNVSFIMDKTPSGNIVSYVPRLGFADIDIVNLIAEQWGFTGEYAETDSQFIFAGDGCELALDKFGDHIVYTSGRPVRRAVPAISDDEAIMIADEFISERVGYINYEQQVVSFDDGVFEVLFIERLGNLKNYGFPNAVRIDGNGRVYSAEVYLLAYDKLDSFPIKSMADAYYGLPLDIGSAVDLTQCSLVYYYRNSILQPCYLFEGDCADGKAFRAFVPAATYG